MAARTSIAGATTQRQRWMGLLARAPSGLLARLAGTIADRPTHDMLRAPEQGLVMVRGRTGGTGAPFNLGEMTVTRCTVQLASGALGHAYVSGRDRAHAEIAAVLDAMLQEPGRRDEIMSEVIGPLEADETGRRADAAAKAAATRVDFFTLVRGEDA